MFRASVGVVEEVMNHQVVFGKEFVVEKLLVDFRTVKQYLKWLLCWLMLFVSINILTVHRGR